MAWFVCKYFSRFKSEEGYSCRLSSKGKLICKLSRGNTGLPFETNKKITFYVKFNAQRLSNEFYSNTMVHIELVAKS
jgi:hypothetical protein